MRLGSLLLLTALLAPAHAGVVEGLPLADPAPSGERDLRARILYSSSRMGEWEPCSCPDLPLGGIAQEADLVATARADLPTWWFDSGDRLFRLDMAMNDTEEALRRLDALLLVDAGTVGGLDAAGVGRLDLGAGVDYLQKLAQRAGYPLVSANLMGPDGQPLFAPRLLLRRGDLVVGVTSVLPEGDRAGAVATEPVAAARDAVRALRAEGAEIVVILSNLGLDADRGLARRSGADLVLGSHSRELLPEGMRAGRALLAQAGSRGRYLGDVRIYRVGPGRGPPLVATVLPIRADGPVHPDVAALVEGQRSRLLDGTLGMPGVPWHTWVEQRGR